MAEDTECILCGCTESMACLEADGKGCSWISHQPPVCSSCRRPWAIVKSMTISELSEEMQRKIVKACWECREESYRCEEIH